MITEQGIQEKANRLVCQYRDLVRYEYPEEFAKVFSTYTRCIPEVGCGWFIHTGSFENFSIEEILFELDYLSRVVSSCFGGVWDSYRYYRKNWETHPEWVCKLGERSGRALTVSWELKALKAALKELQKKIEYPSTDIRYYPQFSYETEKVLLDFDY